MTNQPEKLDWLTKIDPVCWICGYDIRVFNAGDLRRIETHHIERRSIATGKKEDGTPVFDDKTNLFLTCQPCHMSKLDSMPHALQLAYKLKNDPEHFDLERWLRLRDHDLKAPDRVTFREIEVELDLLETKATT